nr:immunoglobulin light chain junction region [Macaca mulatta]MPN65389.1 immunoglobulin light chain junction region [Macaca mulatta]MPN65658.1 immunoglobulin light chain junction region [Macaca mulatta]MPN65988.1 immunoglobulin light chain junction region [Macaca mulatta]MPN66367.1 immunoglobulin light chain junction region [Macaca mulatta]
CSAWDSRLSTLF